MKTLQRWGTDRPCALDMWNRFRSFAHESNAYVIRRWAFLILVFIDLLSCIPPPTTLLSTISGWGVGSWRRPRTHVWLQSERYSASFSVLLSVCAQRRACATTPQPTLLFAILKCSARFRRFSVSKRLHWVNFSVYGLVCYSWTGWLYLFTLKIYDFEI